MKTTKTLYYLGLSLSALVGIWHFFVPLMFGWYSYIPSEYGNLTAGIDWTNYCFSLLLAGTSLLLIALGSKVLAGSGEGLAFFGLLVFVWLNRVGIAVVKPWPLEPIPWAAYGQMIGAVLIATVLLTAFLLLLKRRRLQKAESKE